MQQFADGVSCRTSKGADSRESVPDPRLLVQRSLEVLHQPGTVFEIRVLGVPRGTAKPGTAAGWFNDPKAAADAISTFHSRKATGIYVTLNPVNPALLARTNNRIIESCSHASTDKDIDKRNWLLIDFDPERPDGISSSPEELDAALAIAQRCRDWLRDTYDWPDPIEACSGNGYHHVYRIDLPNDEPSRNLIQRVLQGMAETVRTWQLGQSIQIKVDPVVFNSARIVKLWGTMARKGCNIPDRPHRQSAIIRLPDDLQVISREKLEAIAALAPTTKPSSTMRSQPSKAVASQPDVLERAKKYVSKMPPAIAGQEGHKTTFRTACVLVKDFALTIEDALPILQDWNQTCEPPWSDAELMHKLESAGNAAGPNGKLLSNNRPSRTGTDPQSVQPGPIPKPDTPKAEFVPFPVDCLPEPVRTFVIEAAESMRCDSCFVALPLIAALGAAVGNSRRIRLKNHWTEPCVFWCVIVGQSGTMKSPALEIALSFIRKLQFAAFAEYERALEEHKQRALIYDANLDAWKKERKNNPHAVPPEEPNPPVCARFTCEDTTVEALAVLLESQPRGILMIRDELSGWLNSFDAYKSCKGSDVAHWLSMHRASQMNVDRKSGKRITIIPHAAVSMAGGIQPATMKSALSGRSVGNSDDPGTLKSREHFDNGLAARLLMAMPPRKPKQWTENDVSDETCERMQFLFDDLVSLGMGTDENGKPCPIDLKFDSKAHDLWTRFYNEHALEQVKLNDDVAAVWSKLEGYAARLALLMHLIRYAANDPKLVDSDKIDEQSLTAAIELSRWFGEETSRIYVEIGGRTESLEEQERRKLLRIIRNHPGGITARELMRHCQRLRKDVQLAEEALEELVEKGLGIMQIRPTTVQGGRPTKEFILFDPSRNTESTEPNQVTECPDHSDVDDEVSVPSPTAEDSSSNTNPFDEPVIDIRNLDLS